LAAARTDRVALAWSLFQLWIASPLPVAFGRGVFSDTTSRSIHLAFALFLVYLAYLALKSSPRGRIPMQDLGSRLPVRSAAAIWLGSTRRLPSARARRS